MKFVSFQLPMISFLLAAVVGAAEPLPLSKDYWKDEAFLKSFNGSYRVNARIEPTVNSTERGLLVSIQKLMADGKRKQALEQLKANPFIKTSAAVAFNAGNIQFELGDLKEAAEYYRRALDIFPSFRRAHRNLGFVYARESEWDKALESLSEAVRLGDQDGATYGQIGYARMQKEQYASALQAFRLAQITQPDNVDWKAGVASCLQHLERNEEAVVLLDEVIRVRPEEISYYILQASVMMSLGRNDDAITNLDLVRRLEKLDAGNHLLLANLHLRAGSVRLARPVMLAALQMEEKPAPAAALNTLEFLTQMQKWTLAEEFVETLAKVYTDELSKILERKKRRLSALISIESGKNPKAGAQVLEQLVKEDPLDADSLVLLGRYRMGEKRNEEAEMLFQQAKKIQGNQYAAAMELAKLYVSLTRYSDAVEQLNQALKIRSSQEVEDYRDAVANLVNAVR